MKITAELREEAANMCSMRASEWASESPHITATWDAWDREDSEAWRIARWAFFAAPMHVYLGYRDFNILEWAEAEAMLREGWTP